MAPSPHDFMFTANTPTAEILRHLQEKDAYAHKAYEEIYGRYANNIYTYLVLLFKDRRLAEECTQEAFTRLWANASKLAPLEDVHAWTRRVAINLALDCVRSPKRRNTCLFSRSSEQDQDGDISSFELLLITDGIEEKVCTKIVLRQGLDRLTDLERYLLVLSGTKEYTQKELAGIFNLTENVVQKRVAIAKVKMRAFLHEESNKDNKRGV
jgi:RNA polymerase sigma-70 factor (ECF subfamily)